MKTKLRSIFLFLILSISISLSAQNWLSEGTIWHYNNSSWGRPAPTQIVEITGTTEILGKTCAVLERKLENCNQRPKIDYIHKENDSLFYYNENLNTFQLLYDFSPSFASFYIEDIGNFGNFFHLVENGFCDGYHVAGLRCFKTPGFDLLSFIGPMEECDLIISTEDEKSIPRLGLGTFC